MTTYRKLFAPVSLAFALMTTSAVAKIHTTAFKGVTSHFMVKVKDVKKKEGKDKKTLIQNNNDKENTSDNTSDIKSDESDESFTPVDNTMYSPTFGIIALDTGIVENIRLYGDYEPGYYTKKDEEKDNEDYEKKVEEATVKNQPTPLRGHVVAEGARKYIGDTSKDPLWNVVKILFPTNAGVLNAQTEAPSSFGKYVKDPKTVALLVNFAKKDP